ncbi:MAG: Rid family hydrolase [Dehalococcoidales bacterium]|jgi:2-iminobutanoate/2-iminopropanoate deaminase
MAAIKHIPTPYSYSEAVAASDFVFLSGHLVFGDSFPASLDGTFPSIIKTLAKFGLKPENLVKIHVSFRDVKDLPEFEKSFKKWFPGTIHPVVRYGSSTHLNAKILAIIDGIAYRKEVKMSTVKHVPTPFSYSAAVGAGDYVFLGLHRGFGKDFTTQFHETFKYLKKTLAEFDLTLADIVKVNVWLKNIDDVRIYEKLFEDYFEKDKFPARMGATTQFIDADCLLMIDGVAYRNKD